MNHASLFSGKGLGNAIVPQVAFKIFHAINKMERLTK